MATKPSNSLLAIALLISLLVCSVNAQLYSNFYSYSCPSLQRIVLKNMIQALVKEQRMGASILRLHFHDCFVQGCDASVLLDDTSTFTGEKTAFPNQNSLRGFEVIDAIKSDVENACNATVSCADILALAARDGVFLLGGPYWDVALGRRDSTTASMSLANSNLPSPSSDLATLISKFAAQNLNARDMTALSGAHTIGQARCTTFRGHIYNDTDIDSNFASLRQLTCPFTGGDDNLAPMDLQSPTGFDNDYYQNLLVRKGLFHSDQELFNNGSQDSLVKQYAFDRKLFGYDFVTAMNKMGNISPLTGKNNGQIRLKCGKVN